MAQVIGFENEIPKNIYVSSHDKLSLSSLYYKEGCRSLEWNFHSQSMLYINLGEKISLTEETEKNTVFSYGYIIQKKVQILCALSSFLQMVCLLIILLSIWLLKVGEHVGSVFTI